VLCLTLAVPAYALEPLGSEFAKGGPAYAVCEELRTEMLFYHGLFVQGGNAKQMEVWKKKYKKYVGAYASNRNCRELAKKSMEAHFLKLRAQNAATAPEIASSN
jgi:hypothetical protein